MERDPIDSTAASDLVIASNRLPVYRVVEDGQAQWKTSPGGLVAALTPVLSAAQSASWVGWTGDADIDHAPFEVDDIRNVPVTLTTAELETFYEGFANRTIWPLYHDAVRPPEYHRRWWRPYVTVNRRFAAAMADAVAEGGTVWIHDYHLQLAPAMLRELRPDVRIGFFLHIPMPPQELFAQLPWRERLLRGLLGADVVGFQTQQGADNFAQLARRFTGAEGLGETLVYDGRLVQSRAFPISIDFEHYQRLARTEEVVAKAAEYREQLGARRIFLGVDRLDYTKGIDIRLKAFGDMLRSGNVPAEDCAFVQIAVPSREDVVEYIALRREVERQVGEINGEFGEIGRAVLHYHHQSFDPVDLCALYLAADVMVVTPFRDGMNLVAKEYCAARVEGGGVLVLSEFAGAAHELTDALLVNPHDVDGLVATLAQAYSLSADEADSRMARLRAQIEQNNVFGWSDLFLEALHGK